MIIKIIGCQCLFIALVIFVCITPYSFAQVTFIEHILDDNVHGTASLYACDIDGDEDLDVLGAAKEDQDIVMWRNE